MSPSTSRRSLAEWIYRRALLAFPASFRREFGEDLVQLFNDRRQDRAPGWGAGVVFAARTVSDLAVHAVRERRERHGARIAPFPPPPAGPDGPTRQGFTFGGLMDSLRRDAVYALRTFRRHPTFTAVAMVTLALGVGANTAIFGLINGVLLRPLRFGQPDDLAVVWETSQTDRDVESPTSAGTFLAWREQNASFEDLTVYALRTLIVQVGEGESVSMNGAYVFPNFLTVLRLDPLFGRGFAMDDAPPRQRGAVAIISHRLWRDQFGADPSVVGRSLRVDGTAAEIIGVMPSGVAAPDPDVDLWMPVQWTDGEWHMRYNRELVVFGRLRPEVTLEQAQADLARVHDGLGVGQYVEVYNGWTVNVQSMRDHVIGNADATLVIAFASVGLVLLIACVNIANMLLARAAAREREIAVRAALGAGRGRIARQMLTEAMLMALGGGVLGVGFGHVAHDVILSAQPGVIPRAEELGLDGTALVFALGISMLTGLLFGLAPVVHGARVDLQESLTQGGTRSATAGARQRRLRAMLVTSQLALTVVLLSGAGLLVRTMVALQRIDPGFETDGVLAARMFLRGYRTWEAVGQYFADAQAALTALPGVVAAGATSALPMDPMGINYDLPYRMRGQEDLATEELPEADFRVVTPDYFAALEVPLVSGRMFNAFDADDQPKVALINEAMAREVWPDVDPVGQRFETPAIDWMWFEVVGVVGDTRYYGLDAEARPEIYVAHAQVPRMEMAFVVKTDGDPALLTGPVRNAFRTLNPGMPPHSVMPMATLVADTVAAERFYMLVLGIFAGVAVALSAAGVYGVLSYWVSQRTHEIGVRMALGADRASVRWYVVGHGMTLAGLGIGAGLAASVASTGVLANVLHGVSARDPATLFGVTLIIGGMAMVACALPAFKASRMDPLAALRD